MKNEITQIKISRDEYRVILNEQHIATLLFNSARELWCIEPHEVFGPYCRTEVIPQKSRFEAILTLLNWKVKVRQKVQD